MIHASARADSAGYAVVLDGISSYLGCDLPGDIRGCGEITLSAWIFRESPNGDLISPEPRGQAAVGLGFHIGLSAGKVFCAKGHGSGAYTVLIGNTAVPQSEWHHVAATFDGTTMRVYLDGWLDGELDDPATIVWDDLPPIFPPGQSNYPSPAQLYVGADKHNDLGLGETIPDFSFYEGSIDEAQVWSRALSASEIAYYRGLSLSSLAPGLIHYWKFDEGTGSIAADVNTHQADLTLSPGAAWKSSAAPIVAEVGDDAGLRVTRMRAYPNPARGPVNIQLQLGPGETPSVAVFDLSGRRVADVESAATSWNGSLLLEWDGRDREGRVVANGVYLVRCESASARLSTRLLLLR